MSHEVFNGGGLDVTRLAGPASMGEDRRLWQFTTPLPDGLVQLNRQQLAAMLTVVLRDMTHGDNRLLRREAL